MLGKQVLPAANRFGLLPSGSSFSLFASIEVSLAVANDMLSAGVNALATLTNADGNLAYDTWTVFKATTAGHTVTLPAPALSGGKPQLVGLIITSDSTKLCTLNPNGSEKIDGASSRTLWAGEMAVLLTDGTDWFKVAGKTRPMLCTLRLAGAQTINSGSTPVKVTLDTTDYDNTGLMSDLGSNQMLIKRAAGYSLIGGVRYNNATAPDMQALIYQNGGGVALADSFASAAYVTPSTARLVSCAAGDTIDLRAVHDALGNIPLYPSDPSGANPCWLQAAESPDW